MGSKLITLTGGDLCGKATQAAILTNLIQLRHGECNQMEFPRYDRPFGKLMGAMLDRQTFQISGYWRQDRAPGQYLSRPGIDTMRGGFGWTGTLSKKNDPKTFQALCQADKMDAQREIGDYLIKGHLVCDRYDPELLVYGQVDSSEQWATAAYNELDYKSDIVVVLINRTGQYSRPGEVKDTNETDLSFQHKVYDVYQSIAEERGWKVIEVDKLQKEDVIDSIFNVATAIAGAVTECGLPIAIQPEDKHWLERMIRRRSS
jgi:thymidylate kinase